MQFYTLKITKLYYETNDAITVSFKQPGLKFIKYSPGQYLTLIFRINGRRYIRPYSFSSAPEIDSTLDITVKRVPGGIVSNHILDKLRVGDMIEVMEPMGEFTLNNKLQDENKHLVLWGAGSGITPLFSLAKYALYKKLYNHITLVYGNRNAESVIFNNQINELKEKYSDLLSTWHFYTQAVINQSNPYLIQGRINPKIVLAVMANEGELNNTVHYICGPGGLKESIVKVLTNLGVKKEHIFTEDFELIRDPKEFENIITRVVTVKKSGQEHLVEVAKGKSILEASLNALIELSYSCQTGNCILCKAKLLKGEVKTIGLQKIPPLLNTDECLLCCSYPLDDNVEVLVE
jgi:ring-1,2-phenylacetyl-CoA epoxidase subunit PaaE